MHIRHKITGRVHTMIYPFRKGNHGMHLILDLLLAGVFGLFLYLGYKRGFAGTVLRLGRLLLTFVLTVTCGPYLSDFMDRKFVHPPVLERVSRIFGELSAAAEGRADTLLDSIPDAFHGLIDVERIDPTADIRAVADQLSDTVASQLSFMLSRVLGFILTFVMAYAVLTVAICFIQKLVSLPVIRTVDHLLGLALGALSGLLALILLSSLLATLLIAFGYPEIPEHSLLLRLFSGIRSLLMG